MKNLYKLLFFGILILNINAFNGQEIKSVIYTFDDTTDQLGNVNLNGSNNLNLKYSSDESTFYIANPSISDNSIRFESITTDPATLGKGFVLRNLTATNKLLTNRNISMQPGESFEITFILPGNFSRNVGISLLSNPEIIFPNYETRNSNYVAQLNLNGWGDWSLLNTPDGVSNYTETLPPSANTTYVATFKLVTTSSIEVTLKNSNRNITHSFTTILIDPTQPITAFSIGAEALSIDPGLLFFTNSNNIRYIFPQDYVWHGSNNNVWSNSKNWVNERPPLVTNKSIRVLNSPIQPVISENTTLTINQLFVDDSAKLTIGTNGRVTINSDITNNGTITANSETSILHNGDYLGNGMVLYKKTVTPNKWYLVGSPVTENTLGNYFTNNNLKESESGNLSLATYNPESSSWVYYTESQLESGGDYENNIAYFSGSSIMSSSTTVSFLGKLHNLKNNTSFTSNLYNHPGITNDHNLIGNLFPCFISSSLFLADNSSSFSEETIWFWDNTKNSGTGGYTTILPLIEDFKIAPGQGFFVLPNESNAQFGSVVFNKTIRSHETTNTFLRTNTNRPEIKLFIKNKANKILGSTNIYYIDGTTTGFDNGYDGTMFTGAGNSNAVAVYTNLVDGSNTTNYAKQSIPNSNYENMVIPIGLNASSGSEIIFNAQLNNFPSGLNVYIEDRFLETFVNLSETDNNYNVILDEDSNGIGRFYIHASSKVLSIDSTLQKNNIRIFQEGNLLNIQSNDVKEGKLRIYDITGKVIFNANISIGNKYQLDISNFNTGLYIVEINTSENLKEIKKIIVN